MTAIFDLNFVQCFTYINHHHINSVNYKFTLYIHPYNFLEVIILYYYYHHILFSLQILISFIYTSFIKCNKNYTAERIMPRKLQNYAKIYIIVLYCKTEIKMLVNSQSVVMYKYFFPMFVSSNFL